MHNAKNKRKIISFKKNNINDKNNINEKKKLVRIYKLSSI